MDFNKALRILQGEQGMRTIHVSFHKECGEFDDQGGFGGKTYIYKSFLSDITVGDLVVVEARSHYQVAKVEQIDEEVDVEFDGNLRWAICKVTDQIEMVRQHQAKERSALRRLSQASLRREVRQFMAENDVDSSILQIEDSSVIDNGEDK